MAFTGEFSGPRARLAPGGRMAGPGRYRQRGQTVTEYAVVLLLVVMMSAGALLGVQGALQAYYAMSSTWLILPFP